MQVESWGCDVDLVLKRDQADLGQYVSLIVFGFQILLAIKVMTQFSHQYYHMSVITY